MISLLLAALLALGGYATLVAWRRAPIAGVADATPLHTRELPPPDRLAARPDDPFGDARPTDASAATVAEPVEITILVTGLARTSATAGVLMVAADTQAPLAWLPLGDPSVDTRTRRLPVRAPHRPLRLFVAPNRTTAASGWWASAHVPRPPTAGQSITIDAALHPVKLHFDLPGSTPNAPIALRRVGDPNWRLPPNDPAGLTIDPNATWTVTLGVGDYEVEPLLDGPWQPARFQVHGPLAQRLTFARRPRADRP